MARDFLKRGLPGCTLKGFKELNEERRKAAMPGIAREDSPPHYCEYASASDRAADPVCEVVRRRIADLEACPLDNSAAVSTAPASEDSQKDLFEPPELLNGVMWSKTKNI